VPCVAPRLWPTLSRVWWTVALKPLPFRGSDRLISIHAVDRRSPRERREIPYPDFVEWQRALRSVEAMAAHSNFFVLESGDTTERVQAARVSWNYFDVLGDAEHGDAERSP
jgi:hypothetical protein